MNYGYARVSRDGQTIAAQKAELKAAGCERIFSEKPDGPRETGASAMARLMRELRRGDLVIVTRLDRLARSRRELMDRLEMLARAGVGFRSLAETWADTTRDDGPFLMTVLGGLMQFERELIVERTAQGHAQARARGVKFGPKQKLSDGDRDRILERKAAGESVRDIARAFNVSHSTVSRLGRVRPAAAGPAGGYGVPGE